VSDEEEQGGVALDWLRAVGEFALAVAGGSVAAEDRSVHSSHGLVVLIEGSLESISRVQLSTPIVGLTRASADQLIDERRKLEDDDEREPLQRLLFSFGQLCEVVRTAGYHSDGDANDVEFFVSLFPDWLLRLSEWAESEQYDGLVAAATSARTAYLPIRRRIVPEQRPPG
jgi:hypothetical protein